MCLSIMQSFALFFLFLYSAPTFGGAQVQPTAHIIPEGTESVNGSDVNGGCPEPLSGGLCGNLGTGTISYLIDGNIPVLNTAAPNWASQLVTVKKNSPTVAIPYDHVLLAFDYNTPVSLILVELNLFYCPEWNIGAPNITVYVDEDGWHGFAGYLEGSPGIAVRGNVVLSSQSSCDSFLPVRIPLENIATQHHTWYIVVSFDSQPDIEWVHVGEVRLFDTEPPPPPEPTTDPSTTSSMDTPITDETTSSSATDSVTPTTISPNPTSVGSNCSCEGSPALIAVSAVSLLLSVLLLTVVVVQCLVIGRMRKSLLITADTPHSHVYTEIETHGTIPVLENEAYELHKRTTAQQEAVYEYVQET